MAVDYLAANAASLGLNPQMIATGGYSAGAVAALMLEAGAVDGVNAEVGAVLSLAGGMFGLESLIDSGDPGFYFVPRHHRFRCTVCRIWVPGIRPVD